MADQVVFIIKKDRFDGINIDTGKVQFSSDEEFAAKLKASIIKWKEDKVRGLWVTVQKQHSSVIPACVEAGLEFHHAKPGYVLMNTWLPTDEKDMLPTHCHQFLGSAGFVLNELDQLLVIKERFSSPSNARWKLPGGMADLGEDIGEAARREVFEETGVVAEFVCVLTFRHQHNFRHGCSDLYFVSLMKAKTTEIKHCPQEIADCRWMDLDEYLNADITDANRYFVTKYKEYVAGNGSAFKPEYVNSFDNKSQRLIYSIHRPDSQAS